VWSLLNIVNIYDSSTLSFHYLTCCGLVHSVETLREQPLKGACWAMKIAHIPFGNTVYTLVVLNILWVITVIFLGENIYHMAHKISNSSDIL